MGEWICGWCRGWRAADGGGWLLSGERLVEVQLRLLEEYELFTT
jgi:hypothetical protein